MKSLDPRSKPDRDLCSDDLTELRRLFRSIVQIES